MRYCLLCSTRVVLTFKSVDETLVCDHSSSMFIWALLITLHKVVLNPHECGPFRLKQYFHVVVFIALCRSAKIEPVINQKPKTLSMSTIVVMYYAILPTWTFLIQHLKHHVGKI